MHTFRTAVLAASLVPFAGCSSWEKNAICCDGGYEYRHRNQSESDNASSEVGCPAGRLGEQSSTSC